MLQMPAWRALVFLQDARSIFSSLFFSGDSLHKWRFPAEDSSLVQIFYWTLLNSEDHEDSSLKSDLVTISANFSRRTWAANSNTRISEGELRQMSFSRRASAEEPQQTSFGRETSADELRQMSFGGQAIRQMSIGRRTSTYESSSIKILINVHYKPATLYNVSLITLHTAATKSRSMKSG